jgi:amidophosphoribosyltransferase
MCGFVAIKGVRKAAELAVVGAHELQHRARTYAGAVSCDGQNFYHHAGAGLARQVFSDGRLDRLHGMDALVHLRYPTVAGGKGRDNTQPVYGIYGGKPFAVGHNGNLTNTNELASLLPESIKMATALDTEYIVKLIEHNQSGDIKADLAKVFSMLKGSFALAVLTPEMLIAVQDKSSCHPLSIGQLEEGYCISSEKCAFPIMGARHLFDVEAGSMVIISDRGLKTVQFAEPQQRKCVFELLYNSHPASKVFGVGVARFRYQVGVELERLFPTPGSIDVIITPVPASGNPYAHGFAKSGRSGELCEVMYRNHYVGRTFNAATQALRDEEVSRKFIFDADEVKGKRVVVLDDSIVRGTTLPKIIAMLWNLEAKEVHVRIGTPAIKHICRYGIYMDEDETDLISAKFTPAEICRRMGATSLEFLPLENLKALLSDPGNFCYACMDGKFWN